MDTCRLPDCDQTLLAWLDPDYCSVDHRAVALRLGDRVDHHSVPDGPSWTRPWYAFRPGVMTVSFKLTAEALGTLRRLIDRTERGA